MRVSEIKGPQQGCDALFCFAFLSQTKSPCPQHVRELQIRAS